MEKKGHDFQKGGGSDETFGRGLSGGAGGI